jgi:signal transduction histidine kinase
MADKGGMPEPSVGERPVVRPAALRSLASKFAFFAATLLFWVIVTVLAYDLRQDKFDAGKGLLLCLIALLVSAAISRFTIRLLARPLAMLQAGIRSVENGRLEPIQVSRTGDELEFLGESFNRMIEALAASQTEVRDQRELLEQRIKDRTLQLEEAMRGAQAASRAKSEFVVNVSQELRTPANNIIRTLDLALGNDVTPELAGQLQNAQNGAYSLLSLVSDILDLSKIEAGKMTLEKVPFDLRATLDACLKDQLPRAAENGIEIRVEVSPDLPARLAGDPLRIQQIFSNLISHAVKCTGQGPVLVRLTSDGSAAGDVTLRFTVQDSGTGIPADKLLHIFDNVTPADGGTGLGLALAHRLVELLHGDIRVTSELGRGTTFSVTLPCSKAGEIAPAAPIVRVEAAPGPARILIVEDNVVNQKVVTAVLRKKGFSIELARDGQEALDKLETSGDFDLVLMDVQMPVLDGLEATRLIRKNSRWKWLPIVAMTAHAMAGDKERCLEAGMNGYISKPVHPSHLLETVDEFLLQRTA